MLYVSEYDLGFNLWQLLQSMNQVLVTLAVALPVYGTLGQMINFFY